MGLWNRLIGKPTPADFASMMMHRLRGAGDGRTMKYDPDEFRILIQEGDQTPSVLNLGNVYARYLEAPRAARSTVLQGYVRTVLGTTRELPEDFDAARADLRPKLWARISVEQMRLRNLRDGPIGGDVALAAVPVGEHLLACLAYDWPHSTQSIRPENLEQWGVSLYEALEVARENLAETTHAYSRIGDSLVSFICGDSYDASRILLVDRIRDMGLAGRPVAMVPNRDAIYVTGEDDEPGLAMLAALAAPGLQETYALSGVPLVLDGDTWVDWMPPSGHPSYQAFRDMELSFLGPAYTAQKELLDALHQRDGTDLWVASYSAVKKEGGSLVGYCVWADGVDALLPVTEKVIFVRAGTKEPAAIGSWDHVREIVGHLMERTDDYPARYCIRGFPSDEALQAIGTEDL